MRITSRLLLLLLVMILPAACTLGGPGPEPTPTSAALESYLATLRGMGLDRYVDDEHLEPLGQQALDDSGWVRYDYDPEHLRCIDGGPFHLLARAGKEPEPSEAATPAEGGTPGATPTTGPTATPATEATPSLLWMSDGGACWPGHQDCAREASLAQTMNFGLGAAVPGNPLRDWNVISVPSCDGSLYLGDNEADYDGDGAVDHTHWGLRAISAAVALLEAEFPDSTEIMIAGRGAGGYGTLLATPLVRLRFPSAQIYVWNESGPGLLDPDDPDTWQLILDTWNLTPQLPADCPHCQEQLVNLYRWMLARDSGLRVGLYSSYQDADISDDLLGMPPREFQGLLLTTTDRIWEEFPSRFRRYLVGGDSHGINDYAYEVRGIRIADWLGAMVAGDDIHWPDLRE
jgi:hypothetical protein